VSSLLDKNNGKLYKLFLIKIYVSLKKFLTTTLLLGAMVISPLVTSSNENTYNLDKQWTDQVILNTHPGCFYIKNYELSKNIGTQEDITFKQYVGCVTQKNFRNELIIRSFEPGTYTDYCYLDEDGDSIVDYLIAKNPDGWPIAAYSEKDILHKEIMESGQETYDNIIATIQNLMANKVGF
jgi:hypothetical protein